MTLALTGSGLTIDDVVRVARRGEPVSLDPAALDRMAAARAVVERTLADGVEAYGVTTGSVSASRSGSPPTVTRRYCSDST